MNSINIKLKKSQNGSAIAWIMAVLLLFASIAGWYLYYQSDNKLEKNKRQKERIQQRYNEKSDELYESWDEIQKVRDENYQIKTQLEQGNKASRALSSCTGEKEKQQQTIQAQQQNIDELKQIQANQLSEIDSGVTLLQQCQKDLSATSEKLNNCNTSLSHKEQTEKHALSNCPDIGESSQQEPQQEQEKEKEKEKEKEEQQKEQLPEQQQNRQANAQADPALVSSRPQDESQSCRLQLQTEISNRQQLQQQITENEKQIADYKKQLEDASAAINKFEQLKIELQASNATAERIKKDFANSKQLIDNKQLLIDNLNNKIKQLKADQQNLNNLLSKSDKLYQLCIKEQQTSKTNSELVNKKNELIAKNTIKQLEQKIDLLSAESKQVNELTSQLETELEKQKKSNDDLEKQLQKLLTDKKQLEQKLQVKINNDKKESQAYNKLSAQLKKEIESNMLTISREKDNSTLIRLGNDLIFPAGQTYISKNGTKILSKIAALLKDFPDKKIEITGHTDNIPVRSGQKTMILSNWELSAARAGAVIRYLQHAAKVAPQRMTLVGASQYQPLVKGNSKSGRAKNRRIEIRVLANQ